MSLSIITTPLVRAMNDLFAGLGLSRLPALPPSPISYLWTLPLILSYTISLWVTTDKANDAVRLEPLLAATYDFIIVGAGAGGFVVANRLSTHPNNYSVLLLEAGGEPSPINDIPVFGTFLVNQANTWVYRQVAQNNGVSGFCDGSSPLTTRGKMLGGSTQVNFMMYVRGNKGDYDNWATVLNDSSWSYDNVLPYFKKLENYKGNWPDSTFHGVDGPLTIGRNDVQPGIDQWLAAAAELGYTINQDYNGANQEVFSPVDSTINNGWRESSYKAYYKDAPSKPANLKIVRYAQVTKVNFDENKKAISVNYMRQNLLRTAFVRNEVILSAGALMSPQILMLSGIGPTAHLSSFGIPVIKDLPVGQNFQDHHMAVIGLFLKSPAIDPSRDITPQAVATYLLNGTGLMSSSGITGSGFLRSPYATHNYSDIQLVQASITLSDAVTQSVSSLAGYNLTKLENWLKPYYGKDARIVMALLNRPRSVGQLTLASENYQDMPILDPNYLSHPDDLEALLWTYKKTLQIYENTTAMNSELVPFTVPGCENYTYRSDDFFRCAIKQMTTSLYHHVGSCSMGNVVESSSLKVKGVSGLRVIDASVMPLLPNGNTQAPTYMIGERGAEMILQDWVGQ